MRLKIVFMALFAILVLSLIAEAARMVAVTPTGKKYHLENCRTLARSKQVEIVTLEAAKARGLSACAVCKPGD